MFNQKILQNFRRWKDSADRQPLVLLGARQVGKTTAVKLFSSEFENYIYLNLELKGDRDLFNEALPIKEVFQAILVIKNIQLKPGKTLLFIDEIQNSPAAVKMLRYFYEELQGFGNSNYRSREVGEALRTIERAMLISLIYPTTSLQLPLVADLKKSPKLQFLDTGLLNYFAGLQPSFFQYADLQSIYKGLIAEHIVRQELIAQNAEDNKKNLFWVREKKQSNAEVDVVLPYQSDAIPVEVKSGKSGPLRSLHQFLNEAEHAYAVRLYEGNFEILAARTPEGKAYKLLNLPYFLAGKIHEYLALLAA